MNIAGLTQPKLLLKQWKIDLGSKHVGEELWIYMVIWLYNIQTHIDAGLDIDIDADLGRFSQAMSVSTIVLTVH